MDQQDFNWAISLPGPVFVEVQNSGTWVKTTKAEIRDLAKFVTLEKLDCFTKSGGTYYLVSGD